MAEKQAIDCLRCGAEMHSLGRETLQRRPGLPLGELNFLLVGGMEIEIYSCPRCGKLEFFRPKTPSGELPQKQCPECGAVIDFDYGRCPHCRHEF